MRLPAIVLSALVLLSGLVVAVDFSCTQDSDCVLSTGQDVSCINSICAEDVSDDVTPPLSVFQQRDVVWAPLVVREVPRPRRIGDCPGCLRFAPEAESSFAAFWQFLVYA